jgi:hypothetical protein
MKFVPKNLVFDLWATMIGFWIVSAVAIALGVVVLIWMVVGILKHTK